MAVELLRLVLDTNVFLRGVVSSSSASQLILDRLIARKAVPVISPSVMAEYREILLAPHVLARFPDLAPERVEMILHRLRYVADEYDTTHVQFKFDRDPEDAKFVELAIAGAATHILSLDADLLSLPTSHSDAGKRFRQRLARTRVLSPTDFARQNKSWLGDA